MAGVAVPSVVFVHGAGDQSNVWASVQDALPIPSLAVELPGRGRHPGDLGSYTLESAFELVAAEVDSATGQAPVSLVAHSIGGALSPLLAAHLGDRLVHLIHIAAVAAPAGHLPLATASPTFADNMLRDTDSIRFEVSGRSYVVDGETPPDGLAGLTDRLTLTRWDSLVLGCRPTVGLMPGSFPRTFIRPVHDRLYPADAQSRLAAAMGATRIVPVEAGHNVAGRAPQMLAGTLLDVLGAS